MTVTSPHAARPTAQATVVGLFDSREQADRALAELRRLGFRADQLGFAQRGPAPPAGPAAVPPEAGERPAPEAGSGALAVGDIPGLGPVLLGGLLTGILGGAAAGAVAGGLVGSLLALGLPDAAARRCARAFQAGHALVLVQADGRAEAVDALLRRHGADDVQHGRGAPRGAGEAGPPRAPGGQGADGPLAVRPAHSGTRAVPGMVRSTAAPNFCESRIERKGRAGVALGTEGRFKTCEWCCYCGTWHTGQTLPVLEPAGDPRVWHLCDYCWSLLEVGFHALRPGDDLAYLRDPAGSRLRSTEVYEYIREGFLRGMRSDG